LLFTYLTTDPRIRVKLLCLRNLVSLACMSTSLENFDVPELVGVLKSSPYTSVHRGVLALLRRLSSQKAFPPLSSTAAREICTTFLSNFLLARGTAPQRRARLSCAALAADVLTNLCPPVTDTEREGDQLADSLNDALLYQLISIAAGCTISSDEVGHLLSFS